MNSVPTTMMFDWMIDEYFGVNIIEIDDNSDFSSPVGRVCRGRYGNLLRSIGTGFKRYLFLACESL
jgi:hypothetical protein